MALLDGNNNVTLLKSNSDFSVYSLNGNDICLFVVPEHVNGSLSLYLDLNMESDYKDILSGVKSQQQVIKKIEGDYDLLDNLYKNSVYVVPNFNTSNLSNVLDVNDKQAVFNSITNLAVFTKGIQSVLATKGVSLDTKINIVVKNEVDNKLGNWLSIQNIGKGVSFEELKSNNRSQNMSNPFMNSASTSSNPFADFQNSQSVVDQTVVQSQPSQAVNNQPIFGDSTVQSPSQSQIGQNVQVSSTSVQGPAPVQGVTLESYEQEEVVARPKGRKLELGRKGYVNIVILMAILVGVTLISIQLGKFLYSIYG